MKEDIKEIYLVASEIDYEGLGDIELLLSYEKANEAYEKNSYYHATELVRLSWSDMLTKMVVLTSNVINVNR